MGKSEGRDKEGERLVGFHRGDSCMEEVFSEDLFLQDTMEVETEFFNEIIKGEGEDTPSPAGGEPATSPHAS